MSERVHDRLLCSRGIALHSQDERAARNRRHEREVISSHVRGAYPGEVKALSSACAAKDLSRSRSLS